VNEIEVEHGAPPRTFIRIINVPNMCSNVK
jgi:hypothetical protein